jgi:tRNA/rRNA methyltransferase
MINIILIGTESSENLGAVCRVMKNFGFTNLILVNPKCDVNDIKAEIVSRHAVDILHKAKIMKRMPRLDYLIGTTAKIGSDYNIPRTPLTPEEAVNKINRIKNKKVGIMFGPESSGLNNKIISKCDFIIKIPASDYGTLNLSHAVAIILYELFKSNNKTDFGIEQAGITEKKVLEKKFNNIAKELFSKDRFKIEKQMWKRLIGKATLSKREAFTLMGFLSKLEQRIKNESNLREGKNPKHKGR